MPELHGGVFAVDSFLLYYPARMAQVFISHVHEDGAVSDGIATGLTAEGFSCWSYERDSVPGLSYVDQILEAIAEASAVIFIVSPASLNSRQMDIEVVRAHESNKHLLPVLVGLSHAEFREHKSSWAMLMGSAVSVSLRPNHLDETVARLAGGLRRLGVASAQQARGHVPQKKTLKEPTRSHRDREPVGATPSALSETLTAPLASAVTTQWRTWAILTGFMIAVFGVAIGAWRRLAPMTSAGTTRPVTSATIAAVHNDARPPLGLALSKNKVGMTKPITPATSAPLDDDLPPPPGLDLSKSKFGFVGEAKCAQPTCHGAPLPSEFGSHSAKEVWKWARTLWLNVNIDRHSRAYATLETEPARGIAKRLGVIAPEAQKCLVCHAPPAPRAATSSYSVKEGVTCEHCHGPAEIWLELHTRPDFDQMRAKISGFDNRDIRARAERCGACHIEIDPEIVTAGHMRVDIDIVPYSEIQKHWNDQRGLAEGAFTVAPLIWSASQLVGLRRAAAMVERRAATVPPDSAEAPAGFDEGIRHAGGYYHMVDTILAVLLPGTRDEVAALWNEITTAASSRDFIETRKAARRLRSMLAANERNVLARPVDLEATRKMLGSVTSIGERVDVAEWFKGVEPWDRSPGASRATEPAWAADHVYLAILALCEPAFGEEVCNHVSRAERTLMRAAEDSDPAKFTSTLDAIRRELFH